MLDLVALRIPLLSVQIGASVSRLLKIVNE